MAKELETAINMYVKLCFDTYRAFQAKKPAKRLDSIWENCGIVVRRPGKEKPLKPWLMKESERHYGRDILLHVPPGLSLGDFRRKREKISFALNAEIELEEVNGKVLIRVFDQNLPRMVSFALPEDWEKLTQKMVLPVPVGYSRAGLEIVDITELPHMVVAGETMGGKSNFLHQMIAAILDKCKLYIIDMKRLEFSYLSNYATYAFTLKKAVAILEYLVNELHRRLEILDRAEVVKIQDYRGDDLDYIVLVVDEFSQLSPVLAKSKEEKEAKTYLHSMMVDILTLARCVGIHCVVGTQRPDAQILPGQLKANIPATICFRVKNGVNSDIILDNGKAAHLPRIKGRGIFQFDREREVQVMFLPVEQAKRLLAMNSGEQSEKKSIVSIPSLELVP